MDGYGRGYGSGGPRTPPPAADAGTEALRVVAHVLERAMDTIERLADRPAAGGGPGATPVEHPQNEVLLRRIEQLEAALARYEGRPRRTG